MQKQEIDCLFIHAPGYSPDRRIFPMHMAMGLFALADRLEKKGYSSKILHLGVEKLANKKFSISDYFKSKKVRLVGISLHWYAQSNRCIGLIDQIKSTQPEIKIVLGGFTASFFADEIMRSFKNIDFIIRGDGEIPILALMDELQKSRSQFSLVPNLTWRGGNKIIHNSHTYVATESDISDLNFSNFKLMKHFHTYLNVPMSLSSWSKNNLAGCNTFSLCVGRGCSVSCSFCGGSNGAQHMINGRKKIIFRSQQKVLETIKDAHQAGVDCLSVCFDPDLDREYYRGLFRSVRRNKIRTSMVFECWSLPDFKFLDEFKKTFQKGPHSKIVISPETGSERLRKLNKGFFYTNRELLRVLGYLRRNEIHAEIFFSYPLPYENSRDTRMTYEFMELVKDKIGDFGNIRILNLGMDPASPIFNNPKAFAIRNDTKAFEDYCGGRKANFWHDKGTPGEHLNREYATYGTHSEELNKLIRDIRRLYRRRCYAKAQKLVDLAKKRHGSHEVPHLYFNQLRELRLLGNLCYQRSVRCK